MRTNIKHYMTKKPFVIQPETNLIAAREIMMQWNLRHLPIEKEEKLVGLISDRDLREAMGLPQSQFLCVGDIMKTDLYFVPRSAPVGLVVRDMADLKIGSAIVVDDSSRVVGIFTTTDALKLMADLLDDNSQEVFASNEQMVGNLASGLW